MVKYYYYYHYKSKDLSGTITSQTLQGHFTKLRKEKNVCEAVCVGVLISTVNVQAIEVFCL